MNQTNVIIIIVSVIVVALAISGCAHQPVVPAEVGLAGFWKGILHGFLAPIIFFVSLFTDYRIYEFPNSGLWYDFGFMLGISGFSGGIFGASRKK